MPKHVGVWIDRKHALVVEVDDGTTRLDRLHAGEDEPFPPTQETRAEHRYTRNDFVAEKTLERKSEMERNEMYDAVIKRIDSVRSVWVLGPGEAKDEFVRHLKSRRVQGLEIEVSTSDKMTEPQLVAKVQKHFANATSSSFSS